MRISYELEATWDRLGAVLGLSWARPGPLLGPLGRPLGASWSLLGLSWDLLGLSWGLLELSWGRFETVLSFLGRKS